MRASKNSFVLLTKNSRVILSCKSITCHCPRNSFNNLLILRPAIGHFFSFYPSSHPQLFPWPVPHLDCQLTLAYRLQSIYIDHKDQQKCQTTLILTCE